MDNVERNIEQTENVILFEGISFFVIDHLDSLDVTEAKTYDAVIINGKDESFIRQIVIRIRAHKDSAIYLKPVFLLKGVSIIDP